MRANNWPEPEIEEIANRVRFTVKLPKILPLTKEQSRKSYGPGQSEMNKTSGNSDFRNKKELGGAQSRAQSTSHSEKILFALEEVNLSASELAHNLGLESKSGAIKRAVKDLLLRELVEYTIPDKPNSRLQKYRLTELGKQILELRKAGN